MDTLSGLKAMSNQKGKSAKPRRPAVLPTTTILESSSFDSYALWLVSWRFSLKGVVKGTRDKPRVVGRETHRPHFTPSDDHVVAHLAQYYQRTIHRLLCAVHAPVPNHHTEINVV